MHVLTADAFQRAIFIDYEGNKGAPGTKQSPPPTLLGYLEGDSVRAGIVEPLFALHCSRKHGAKHAVAADHHALVLELLERSEREHRVIVSWSLHDLHHMIRAAPERESRLTAAHRNAITPVKRHFRKREIPLPEQGARLYDMCEQLGVGVIEKYGSGLVGKNLRLIRSQLASGKSYGDLAPSARLAWREIVKHNRQDLLCMKAVLERLFSGQG